MHSKIYLETFGCSFNQASSEIMEGILLENDHEIVDTIETSNIILLNTCVVKTNTEARILHKIKTYTKSFPSKSLLIAGCMPEVISEKLLTMNSGINLLGPHFITNVAKAIHSIAEGKQYLQIGKRNESKLNLPRRAQSPVIGKIQIAQGCLNNCAYCITKHAMGNLYSYPSAEILKEIKSDLETGFREFWLTAQDTGAYGFDSSTSLPALLDQIVHIPFDFRIRIGMMNPSSLKQIYVPLIHSYSNPKIYKFLHVPIQSGNDQILEKMNRTYKISEVHKILTAIRTKIPEISISIDIIVGFPSETDEQFQDTISVVKEIQPDIVNISKFGARPHTVAAQMKPLPTKVVKARSTLISKICHEISRKKNNRYLETSPVQRVLTIASGKSGGTIARTTNYKPVILEGNCKLGAFYDVKLVDASKNHLRAIRLKD